MKYAIGKKNGTGAFIFVKAWKGETLKLAAEANDAALLEGNLSFNSKKEARSYLQQYLKKSENLPKYNPAEDRLIAVIGSVYPGDRTTVKVHVKDNGEGAKVLVHKVKSVGGSPMLVGGLGRLAPGVARRLAQLLTSAAQTAEDADNPNAPASSPSSN